MVIGEVALGTLKDRVGTLMRLHDLRVTKVVDHDDVMVLIEAKQLAGSGVGYVDAHLLASARATRGCWLWTRDKRLRAAAERLQVFRDPLEDAGGN